MRQKIAELINIIFGFRKFLLMLILYVVGIVFRIENLLSGGEMVNLFSNTTIAFMGANGVEHVVTAVREYNAGKSAAGAIKSTVMPQGDNLVPEDPEPADVPRKAGV